MGGRGGVTNTQTNYPASPWVSAALRSCCLYPGTKHRELGIKVITAGLQTEEGGAGRRPGRTAADTRALFLLRFFSPSYSQLPAQLRSWKQFVKVQMKDAAR